MKPFEENEIILFDGHIARVFAIGADNVLGKRTWSMAIDYGSGYDVWEETPGIWKDSIGNVHKIVKLQNSDKLAGGLADNRQLSDFDPNQLEKGIKHEMEHTHDEKLAAEIAMDHLTEDPNYYDKIQQIENFRLFVRSIIAETWSQNLSKVMNTPETINNSDDEYDPDDMNPYNANDKLEKVNANAHPKTQSAKSQRAGIVRGSGPGNARMPGGRNQGYSG